MNDFTPFIDSRLKIGWDERVGHGVFASEPIGKGHFIEIAPVVVIDKPPEDQNLFKYIVMWGDRLAIPLGWTMIYNHSDNNCCEYSTNLHDGLFAIMTVRDVPKGAQLTVNYGIQWFASRNMEKFLL